MSERPPKRILALFREHGRLVSKMFATDPRDKSVWPALNAVRAQLDAYEMELHWPGFRHSDYALLAADVVLMRAHLLLAAAELDRRGASEAAGEAREAARVTARREAGAARDVEGER